ncbi:single-strand DNA endonuclease ASTE1-like [Parasteatoda tepidariorum]|uniref:single-strand DNA endonuclease ASTE1-like n=1 Tax=Parasteatoda tepidariorum TaxID=114398 RepID=UPI001C725A9C|nr:protein asteroid homolog 1-like [Parasteatoda tepidariorum]
MGVKSLSTFMDANPHLTMPYKLHDCTIVIDGNNLLHFLYSFNKISYVFGGDYITYTSKVGAYFSSFKKCNIKPIVVLDGGKDDSDRYLPTQIERWRQRVSRVKIASETGKIEEPFLPINAKSVFKNTLFKLGITFVQCEFESDGHMASLANHFNCPVLSEDSDFYIFDVKNGYIRTSSLDSCSVLTSEDNKTKYLSCKIYHINKFLSFYPSINKSNLQLLACLAGNDFIKYEDLRPIAWYFYPQPGQKIEQILNYLGTREYVEVLGDILSLINKEKQEAFKRLLDYSVNSYKIKVSKLSYLFDNNNMLSDTKLLPTSQLVAPCGTPFPKEYVRKHSQGRLPPLFLNVINLHRSFMRTQVGDFVDRSSYNCSCFVRQVIYGILFHHETASTNMKDHKSLCLLDVDEYDVDKGFEIFFKTKPMLALPSGKPVPHLHQIKHMDKTARLEFLAEVIGIKTFYLKHFPEKLQLLFAIICYWLRNCSPKPTKEFFLALLLCITHFYVLHESVLTYPILQDKIDADLSKMYYSLRNITSNSAKKQAEFAQTFPRDTKISLQHHFDVYVIHSYNQLQTCFKYLMSLNQLLESPLKSINSESIFEGSMLCSLAKEIESNPESDIFIELFLGKETASQNVFNIMLKKVFQNIPPGFPWRETPNWNSEKSKFFRKLGF